MSNIFGAPRAGAPNGSDEARAVPRGDVVGSYNSYLDAQKAVDYLADQQFPVQMVSIVGNDLKMVERVTGRLTYPRVALSGALSGMWFGLFVGVMLSFFSTTPGQPAFFAGTFNGHPPTSAAALATIDKLQREPVHEHVFALGERTRQGLRALYARLGVPTVVSGYGSVFVTYFLDGPVTSYDDLLANDVELFTGYRHELRKHGIFELPLNLKRSHFSYAHTDADVDRLLEATEAAVTTVLAQPAVFVIFGSERWPICFPPRPKSIVQATGESIMGGTPGIASPRPPSPRAAGRRPHPCVRTRSGSA